MLRVLLETEARRPRRAAGAVMAVVLHAVVAVAALRVRANPALAGAKPEEVTLRAPVAMRAAATGAGAVRGAPASPPSLASPTVAPTGVTAVEVGLELPPVDLGGPPGTGLERGVVAGEGAVEGGAADASGAGDAPFEFAAVERPAVGLAGNPAPEYPASLRRAGVAGQVVIQFVVDTLGRAEPGSMVVVHTTHPAFVAAVAAVLPRWRFAPAEAGGRRVRMLVQQPIAFDVAR